MSICHITRRHPAAHCWRRVHHGASNKADNIATGYANLSLLALLAQERQVLWRQLVVTCIDQGKRVATPIVAIATLATTSMVVLVVLGMRLATVQKNNTKNVERMVNCNAPNFGAGQPVPPTLNFNLCERGHKTTSVSLKAMTICKVPTRP